MRKPIANPAAVLREEFDDCAVLFDPDTAEVAGLNETGVAIWKLLDGSRTVRQVVDEIRERFDGVPPDATVFVEGFVDDLSRRGFVGYQLNAPSESEGGQR